MVLGGQEEEEDVATADRPCQCMSPNPLWLEGALRVGIFNFLLIYSKYLELLLKQHVLNE